MTIGQVMKSLRKKTKTNSIEDMEKMYLDATDNNLNMLVPWYLMAAFAYYVQDNPILPDHTFDHMAKKMLSHWEEIDHFHKDKITKDDLAAGTYLGEYPSRVKYAVESVRGT